MQSAWHSAWDRINLRNVSYILFRLPPELFQTVSVFFPFPKCLPHCFALRLCSSDIGNRKSLISVIRELEDLKNILLLNTSVFLPRKCGNWTR